MISLEALVMMRRNSFSPALQEEGGARPEKPSSVARVKEVQSALRRLVKVRCGGSGKSIEKAPPSRMKTGRWSEFRVVRVDHSESMPM